MEDLVFIEEQFPVSKVSKESYKERKANLGQTLTGLGKWWGRKPLVVVRAAIIGMLMPASDNPKRDQEIFLKIMTMDDDGLWKRRSKPIPSKALQSLFSEKEWNELPLDSSGIPKRSWSTGLTSEEKEAVLRKAFDRMSYDEKLTYCDRPEQIDRPDEASWREINEHLGTHTESLQGLVAELGKRRFGHIPKVGDAFCGAGSIPSETAFLDELYPEIEDEVRQQLDHMLALDDKENPNFTDTDYQLAAYAAALRVLTKYNDVEGRDIQHELFRHKQAGEQSAFEKVIDRAVEIASDHLVPKGLQSRYWKVLSATERLYLKGLELETHKEARSGAYQELAKGFGVREYTHLYFKAKANAVRFKTGSEFKKKDLGKGEFGTTTVRNILFAVHETVRTDDARQGLNWLREEVPTYWQQRKQIVVILNYLAALSHTSHMPHWEKDADAALRLAGVVKNDHAGTRL